LQTGGEVFLGGGIMDEILLEESLKASKDEKKIRKIFSESSAWYSYCEFAARRLKEKYYADEDYWKLNDCTQTISIRYSHFPVKLKLFMNETVADALVNQKQEKLNNRSFKEVFVEALQSAKEGIHENAPELIFLTGGVSKLPAVRVWCREVFPDAVVIAGSEPEFSVSKGLAWCGKIDHEMKEFRAEIEQLKQSSAVEQIVEKHLNDLYKASVSALVHPIMEDVVMPVIEKWRDGAIEKLSDIDDVLQNDIDTWLHTDEARQLLAKPVASWLKTVSYELEEYTIPICTKHNVPYSALSITSYLA